MKKELKVVKKGSKTLQEFKEFIARGNVIDLAVGVIIGDAFGKIVTSIVNDVLMPLLGIIIGGVDFSNLSIKIGDATITYGSFIQNVINFLIIAACIFAIIKLINKLSKRNEHKEEKQAEVKRDEQVLLLEEIRDLLANDKKAAQ